MSRPEFATLLGLTLLLWGSAARAQGQQSAYFKISGPHLVQHHIYYRERHRGPACNGPVVRNMPCLGANGLIVWR
jgi:hypothetical protein